MNGGTDELHEAIVKGQVDCVKTLLKNGANLEAENKDGIRPLHLAIVCGQNEVLDILIAHKCDVNAVTKSVSCLNSRTGRVSPLYKAIESRNSTAFTALIKAGADVNAMNADTTPLQLCATLNFTEHARILINQQARVDELRGGVSALHQAVIKKNIEMIELLIANGASVSIKDFYFDVTPLHLAVVHGKLNLVELLIRHGADLNSMTKAMETPISMCIIRNIPEILEYLLLNGAHINNCTNLRFIMLMIIARPNTVQNFKLLLKHGLCVSERMNLNTTALHAITSETDVEVIQILLDYNVNFNMADKFKLCPIHYATLAGHVDVVQLLIGKGVPVDCVGVNNWTPLFLAAGSGYGRLVEVLLLKGADVNKKDSCGQTPLFYALSGLPLFQKKCITPEVLISYDSLQSYFEYQVMHYVQQPLKQFLGSKFSIHAVADVYSIATILIRNGAIIDLKVFETLQILGDTLNDITYSKLKFYTDIFKGAAENKDSLVKACIEEGTVVDCVDIKLGTPLTYACKTGSCKAVETLLASGANPNFKTQTGITPLHYAALQGDVDMVISLLWKGAMYDAQNGSRRKPINFAKKANKPIIVFFFKIIENLFHSAKTGDLTILNSLKILKNVYSLKRSCLGIDKSKCLNQCNLFFVIKNSGGKNVAQVAQANNNSMFVYFLWDTLKVL